MQKWNKIADTDTAEKPITLSSIEDVEEVIKAMKNGEAGKPSKRYKVIMQN